MSNRFRGPLCDPDYRYLAELGRKHCERIIRVRPARPNQSPMEVAANYLRPPIFYFVGMTIMAHLGSHQYDPDYIHDWLRKKLLKDYFNFWGQEESIGPNSSIIQAVWFRCLQYHCQVLDPVVWFDPADWKLDPKTRHSVVGRYELVVTEIQVTERHGDQIVFARLAGSDMVAVTGGPSGKLNYILCNWNEAHPEWKKTWRTLDGIFMDRCCRVDWRRAIQSTLVRAGDRIIAHRMYRRMRDGMVQANDWTAYRNGSPISIRGPWLRDTGSKKKCECWRRY